jgi:hypothetical protein
VDPHRLASEARLEEPLALQVAEALRQCGAQGIGQVRSAVQSHCSATAGWHVLPAMLQLAGMYCLQCHSWLACAACDT